MPSVLYKLKAKRRQSSGIQEIDQPSPRTGIIRTITRKALKNKETEGLTLGKGLDLLFRHKCSAIKEIREEEHFNWTRLDSVLQTPCLTYVWFALKCKSVHNFTAFIAQHSTNMYTAPTRDYARCWEFHIGPIWPHPVGEAP